MNKQETISNKKYHHKKRIKKSHDRTPLEIRDDPNTRFYEGTLIKITPGKGDMLRLHMTKVKGVRKMYDVIVTKPCKQDEMIFLMPKHRENTYNFAKRCKPNEILLIMLRANSEKKYTIQEIQYQGVGSLRC